MSQFFADQIDQLDPAIDQLAVRDRNFDRFALMLIDNVVELVFHQHAKDKVTWGRAFEANHKPKSEWKTAVAATGQGFDSKVRYARETNLISASMAGSIQYLHSFRLCLPSREPTRGHPALARGVLLSSGMHRARRIQANVL
ncbi:hypothetical protein [Ideonella sp. YS5]|uniref:hypothetical protein n=1 Tax=Ideonella sp. YS5 TaxID=3453714 RepID=UPI003EE9B1D3